MNEARWNRTSAYLGEVFGREDPHLRQLILDAWEAGLPEISVSAEVGRLLVEDHLAPVPFSHPAMAGLLLAGDDGPVPVFDMRGLRGTAPPAHVPGATVALFPTAKGPVGLRLEQLLGTIASYEPLSESAAEYMRSAPWLVIFPGVAISLAVFGTNLLGDALRDTLDPRQRG